jgi:putative nucleotidyltransferase with HDIG domain
MPASLLHRRPNAPAARAEVRQAALKDLECLESYPMLSETTIWAMAMVDNPNISLAEVADLVRRDAVIASAVLRRANSAEYAGRPVDSIQQAVLRVGLQECGKLLCLMGARALAGRHPAGVQERCDEVHRHSLFVANLAGEMNRAAGLGFGGAEFTAGLLHDIGRVILHVKCPPEVTESAPTSAGGEDVLGAERARFGIDHCQIGAHFAQRNNLPGQLRRAILNHHRPWEERDEPALVALVAFANRLANYAQWEHNVRRYNFAACRAFRALTGGWSGPREESFARALPGVVVRALRSTRSVLKSFA